MRLFLTLVTRTSEFDDNEELVRSELHGASTSQIHKSDSEPDVESEPETNRSSTPALMDDHNDYSAEDEADMDMHNTSQPTNTLCDQSPATTSSIQTSISTNSQSPNSLQVTATSSITNLPAAANFGSSSTNQRPKRVIRPRVQADQGMFGDEGCAARHCDEPYRVGDMVKCASITCDSQVSRHVPLFVCNVALTVFVSFQFHLTCINSPVIEGEWFCDDNCRTDSGFRSKKRRI
jgi:hypothetical protein